MKIASIVKPSKRKIIILITLIIVGIIGFNFFGQKKQAPLQFASVKKQDIKLTVSSSGTLTGKNAVNLKFKSSGKLSYISVKAGDKVTQGEAIAGLDTQDLAIALQQAQNTLRDKQAIVDKIHDDVKDHDKDESFTQKQTRTTAEVARDNAYDGVKAAQRAFQDAVITSPISGLITQVSLIPGQVVSASDTIAQVVDFTSIYFDTDIDEADIEKVSLGQKAEISLDAYSDKIFEGEVSEIIPQTKTTSSGATVISVRIKMDNFSVMPINGLSGQAAIIIEQTKNALTIPLEALRDDNSVVIQTGQALGTQKVTPGIKSDTDVEIEEGLQENETVLLNPPANGSLQNRSQNPLNNVFRFFRFGGGGNFRGR